MSIDVTSIKKSDDYRFLGLGNVPWDTNLNDLNLCAATLDQQYPRVWANDPFAMQAVLSKTVTHHVFSSKDSPHFFSGSWTQTESHPIQARAQVVEVHANAVVEYVMHQHDFLNPAFMRMCFKIQANGQLKLTLVQNGNQHAQARISLYFQGEGATAKVNTLQLGKDTERQDVWIEAFHEVPHTSSEVLSIAAVKDRAHTVFNGTLSILPSAPFTEASQKSKNLILSKMASVDSFPKLLIENSEVKCSHGSSVSTLEPDQLIYLRSRGITASEAERMITAGYIRQAIDGISDESVRMHLLRLEEY